MSKNSLRQWRHLVLSMRSTYDLCMTWTPFNDQIPREYLPEIQRAKAAREQTLQAAKEDSMNRLMKDLAVDRARDPETAGDSWDPSTEEDEEVDEDLDVNIIDRSKFPP